MKVVAGLRFGRLTAVEDVGRSSDCHRMWKCICDCGAYCVRQTNNLQSKARFISCGCAASEAATIHGGRGTNTYNAWGGAIARCHNPRSKDFPSYGGRGIVVCDEWRQSFVAFRDHMGECPQGLSIDRIDVDGHYEPGNCRWATPLQQSRNKRNSITIDLGGKSSSLKEIAESIGISYGAAFMRLKRGKLHDSL